MKIKEIWKNYKVVWIGGLIGGVIGLLIMLFGSNYKLFSIFFIPFIFMNENFMCKIFKVTTDCGLWGGIIWGGLYTILIFAFIGILISLLIKKLKKVMYEI